MRKEFPRPSYSYQRNNNRNFNRQIVDTSTVPVDMMTGRVDQWPDQMTAGTDSISFKRTAASLALIAVSACLHAGPGVVAPRITESSAVFAAPDVMPRQKR